jgi:hypothetical protein
MNKIGGAGSGYVRHLLLQVDRNTGSFTCGGHPFGQLTEPTANYSKTGIRMHLVLESKKSQIRTVVRPRHDKDTCQV